MTVYSTQFFIATYEGPGAVFGYAIPVGTVAVVRTISIHDPHGNAIASLGIESNPYLIGVQYVPGGEQFHGTWNGYQVFNYGQDMWFSANNNDTDMIVSGYLLYLP